MKHKNTGLVLVAASLAVPVLVLAGCGGGNGGIVNPTSTPIPTTTSTPSATPTPTSVPQTVARFAGNYTGAYVAIGSASGADVSGTFTATSSSTGQITGNVTQDNGPSTTATGTVTSAGTLNVSASGSVVVPAGDALRASTAIVAPTATPKPVTITYLTKLSGTATLDNGASLFAGTLLTTQSNGNNPRGRFVGIRNATTASPYAGTYSGTSNGTITSTGGAIPATLAFTVSTNGLIRGTYSRTTAGVRVRPLAGTIDASGKATLVALAEEENPVGSGTFTLVVTNLTGTGMTTGSVKISGTLNRTGTSTVAATGTFSATRTSTATQ